MIEYDIKINRVDKKMINKGNILIGLSGGVDSAVSAYLLQKAGYTVTGCFLCLTKQSSFDSADAVSAQQVADKLGIELIKADHKNQFKKNVVEYFSSEYLAGRTPNPCIRCNPTTKFASLIEEADKRGIEKIATGHYANITHKDGRAFISASPSKKDQSYFLYRVDESVLSRVEFPLGNFMTKDEIRAIGKDIGFIAADKPDSLEVCFIPDNDYARFICEECGYIPKEGDFLDADGTVIGRHSGIINYTVGQRKGLGAFGAPRYVKNINAKDNTVTLCKKDERFGTFLEADNIVWNGDFPEGSFEAQVKIRSTAKATEAAVTVTENKMAVSFREPVLAPTPGQSAVVYKDGIVLGGGIIK